MEEHMSCKERDLFRTFVRSAKHYFEFGCGGSTIFACSVPTLQSITSVESDEAYIEKLKEYCPRAIFLYAMIGPTKEWGNPTDSSYDWSTYSQQWMKRSVEPDVVLIDGRFRVACALQVALTSDPFVIIHDFTNRKQYQVLLQFFKILHKQDTLVVLKKKHPVLRTLIRDTLKLYIMNPD